MFFVHAELEPLEDRAAKARAARRAVLAGRIDLEHTVRGPAELRFCSILSCGEDTYPAMECVIHGAPFFARLRKLREAIDAVLAPELEAPEPTPAADVAPLEADEAEPPHVPQLEAPAPRLALAARKRAAR